MEVRHLTDNLSIEYRGDGNNKPVLRGYAAVFYDGTPDTEFKITPTLVERILPGAFDKALQGKPDIRALYDHDSRMVLGRTPKTLRVDVDARGLRYEIDADTTIGRQIVESVKRGDISGSSFGAIFTEDNIKREGQTLVREILEADLREVSPAAFPAYQAATVEARSAAEQRVNEVLSTKAIQDLDAAREKLAELRALLQEETKTTKK